MKGRTWRISLPDGTEIEMASKNFQGLVAGGGGTGDTGGTGTRGTGRGRRGGRGGARGGRGS